MILNSVRVNFLVALMFLLGNIQLSFGATEDQCWRTTSDTSAAKNQFLYEEPSIFLSKMLEERRCDECSTFERAKNICNLYRGFIKEYY
jgi:hypothetical protein